MGREERAISAEGRVRLCLKMINQISSDVMGANINDWYTQVAVFLSMGVTAIHIKGNGWQK